MLCFTYSMVHPGTPWDTLGHPVQPQQHGEIVTMMQSALLFLHINHNWGNM